MFGDHAPVGASVWCADRLAFVEDRRRAMQERRIDDVGVTHDPPDVGRRPEDFARIDSVQILHAPLERDHVSAVVTHDTLRASRRSRCVEDVQRIGCRDDHAAGLTSLALGVGNRLRPVEIAGCTAGDRLDVVTTRRHARGELATEELRPTRHLAPVALDDEQKAHRVRAPPAGSQCQRISAHRLQ